MTGSDSSFQVGCSSGGDLERLFIECGVASFLISDRYDAVILGLAVWTRRSLEYTVDELGRPYGLMASGTVY